MSKLLMLDKEYKEFDISIHDQVGLYIGRIWFQSGIDYNGENLEFDIKADSLEECFTKCKKKVDEITDYYQDQAKRYAWKG